MATTSEPSATIDGLSHSCHAAGSLTAGSLTKSNVGAGWYAVPGEPNVSEASAQFVIPTVTCNVAHGAEAFYPGIWVYDTSGTLTQQVDINIICIDGVVTTMQDVICILGSTAGCAQNLNVSPGDRIVATFSESAWHTQGQIEDLTTGLIDYIYDGTPGPTSDNSVLFGDAGPGPFGATHVPTFGTVPFSKVTIDGYYMSEYSVRYATALKTAAAVQIKTGPLRQDGDAFTTTWLHF